MPSASWRAAARFKVIPSTLMRIESARRKTAAERIEEPAPSRRMELSDLRGESLSNSGNLGKAIVPEEHVQLAAKAFDGICSRQNRPGPGKGFPRGAGDNRPISRRARATACGFAFMDGHARESRRPSP